MQWCEAVVHTTTIGSDIISEELMMLGAAGTEIIDRADVPDPRNPGVHWELYDPKMLDESMGGKEYEGRKSFAEKLKDIFN